MAGIAFSFFFFSFFASGRHLVGVCSSLQYGLHGQLPESPLAAYWVSFIFLTFQFFFSFYSLILLEPIFFSSFFWKSARMENISSSVYLNMSLFYAYLWMIFWEWTLFCFIILKVLLHRLLIYSVFPLEVNAILGPKSFLLETYNFSIFDALLWVCLLMCHAFGSLF